MTVSVLTGSRTVPLRHTVAVVLGVTVLLSTVVHAVLALNSPSPWIVPDELRYSELAKSLADGGLPKIRDEVSFGFGLGYPALLAPLWASFDNVAHAYAVAKVLNALILSITAVPAYFLARRFVTDSSALVVAAMSVSLPSLLYAGTLMTEVALYPAFVLALLGITAALERPSVINQTVALGTIGLASVVKVLGAMLLVAYLVAIFLYHWLDTRQGSQWRLRLRMYRQTLIALSGIVVVAGASAVTLGRSPADALGAYAVVLGSIDVLAIPWWTVLHAAEFDLYVAVIPFAATALVVAGGLRREAGRRLALLTALTISVSVTFFTTVAAYSSDPLPGTVGQAASAGAHERSTFIMAPLVFIGLMVWLRERPGRTPVVTATVLCAALLPAIIPIDRFTENVNFQAFALVPWVLIRDSDMWPAGVLAFTSALALLFGLAIRTGAHTVAVVGPVVCVLLAVTVIAQSEMRDDSEWTRSVGVGSTLNWVDEAVGGEASVSVLWFESPGSPFVQPAPRHRVVWINELFNRSIGAVYELGSPMPYELPSTHVRLEGGRVVLDDGRPAALGDLVLAPCHVRIKGVPIARDPPTGAVVYRVSETVRATVVKPGSCPTS
ncbi:MAG: hypothetical protein M3546_09985 [Actinomycetota bacterium]|nr:hypothetical protein [Actinomycetota bacterium]